MFKFLTIYGPWGRPDMSLFKFTKAILNGEPIDVYNNGEMSQDFIYLDDLVNGMRLLMGIIPCQSDGTENKIDTFDSKSLVAQFWVVNIGHLRPEKLTDFIEATEKALGIDAIKNFMPMQTGDVPVIFAKTIFCYKFWQVSQQVQILKMVFRNFWAGLATMKMHKLILWKLKMAVMKPEFKMCNSKTFLDVLT